MFNVRPAYCAFAVVSAALAYVPAAQGGIDFGKIIMKYNGLSETGVVHVGPNSNFDMSLSADTIDPSISSISMTVSFQPQAMDIQGITVNSAADPSFDLSSTTNADAAGDTFDTVTETLSGGATWGAGSQDLLVAKIRSGGGRASTDFSIINVVAKDALGNVVTTDFSNDFSVVVDAPEPITLPLLTVGAIGMFLRRRRQN